MVLLELRRTHGWRWLALMPGLICLPQGLHAQSDSIVGDRALVRAERAEARAVETLQQQERFKQLKALGAKNFKRQQTRLRKSPAFTPQDGRALTIEVERQQKEVSVVLNGWFCGGQERTETRTFVSSASALVDALNALAIKPGFREEVVEVAFRELQAGFVGRGLFTGLSLTPASLAAAEQLIDSSQAGQVLQEITFRIKPTEGGVHSLNGCWSRDDLQLADRIKRGAISFIKRALTGYKQRLRVNRRVLEQQGAKS